MAVSCCWFRTKKQDAAHVVAKESHADADMLRVGTQVANLPSISLYEKCGFHVAETTYVLHAHVQAPLGPA